MLSKTEKVFGIIVIFLVGLLGVSIYTQGFESLGLDFLKRDSLSTEEVKTKVFDYVVENFNVDKDQLSITSVSKENGLYKLTIISQGATVNSYLTGDGGIFFPQGFVLNETEVAGAEAPTTTQELPKSDKPDIKLFSMSFCPYGNQAEDALRPVVEAFSGKINVEPHYVLYSNYQGGGSKYCVDEASEYCAMHGIAELRQNIRERCVYQENPELFWQFVTNVNADCTVDTVETCWKNVANGLSLNESSLAQCVETNAIQFSSADKKLSDQYSITGSPVLLINETRYTGQRTAESYKLAICSAFTNPPEECSVILDNSDAAPSGGCGS
ncbi:hypothetical protein KJ596_02765 [Patescibacteria group bacterium]|nr:hypothetical protein [Patescibacteria group bacterium]MBU1868444.1 hypothetical protein [Patescibacteria group bacterium]